MAAQEIRQGVIVRKGALRAERTLLAGIDEFVEDPIPRDFGTRRPAMPLSCSLNSFNSDLQILSNDDPVFRWSKHLSRVQVNTHRLVLKVTRARTMKAVTQNHRSAQH
jgi:hypothetical protein